MSLGQNKKGLEFSTLIEIILIIVATGLIIGVFSVASSRADEKTSENLCRGFNALRFGTQLGTPVGTYNVAPRACKTIDKGDLPGKDYKDNVNGLKEGTKAQIRDLMARCWWMWLEGNQQNMFDKSFYNTQNGCFVCYTFSIDKGMQSFDYSEFAASMNAPYYAIDSSDRCAPAGQGGYCRASCNSNYEKEVPSNRCKKEEKCCADTSECVSKGGRCSSAENYVQFNNWQCKTGNCFIKKENMASYLDYMQGTKGVSGGAGKVLFGDGGGFKSGSKYAITFVSPGERFDFNVGTGIFTTALGTTITIAGVVSGIGTIPTLILAGATAYSGALTNAAGTINDINYIMLSKYDTVTDKCAIEAGAGEK